MIRKFYLLIPVVCILIGIVAVSANEIHGVLILLTGSKLVAVLGRLVEDPVAMNLRAGSCFFTYTNSQDRLKAITDSSGTL